MKVVVVFDTVRGNTGAIARVVAEALPEAIEAIPVEEASPAGLEAADLLFIGSPTRGSAPTQAMQALLGRIGPPRRGGRVAAFDTRLSWPLLAKRGGFAAEKIALNLSGKGWDMAMRPEGFCVSGLLRTRLQPGEIERAQAWASRVYASVERE